MSNFAAVLTLVQAPAPADFCVDEPFDDLWHYKCVVSSRSLANIRAGCTSVLADTQIQKPSPGGSPRSTLPSVPKFTFFKDQANGQAFSVCSEYESDTSSPSSAELSPRGSGSPTEPFLIDVDSGSPAERYAPLAPPICGAETDALVAREDEMSPAPELVGCYVSQAERQVLQGVFHTFDENFDGKISFDELGKAFEKVGIVKTRHGISSLLATMTLKSDGYVDEDEFVNLYVSACNFIDELDVEENQSRTDRDLLEAFQLFDMDKDGFISPTELQSVLCGLGFSQAQELDACVKMISRVDENGDGQVDFYEFKKMFGVEEKPHTFAC